MSLICFGRCNFPKWSAMPAQPFTLLNVPMKNNSNFTWSLFVKARFETEEARIRRKSKSFFTTESIQFDPSWPTVFFNVLNHVESIASPGNNLTFLLYSMLFLRGQEFAWKFPFVWSMFFFPTYFLCVRFPAWSCCLQLNEHQQLIMKLPDCMVHWFQDHLADSTHSKLKQSKTSINKLLVFF